MLKAINGIVALGCLLVGLATVPACRPATAATYGGNPSLGGSGLSSVTTNATLTGAGTIASPLGVPTSSATVYVAAVDCTSTGADKGTIVPAVAGSMFVITRWSATVSAKTGTATQIPLFNVGSNSPSFNDWLPGTSAPIGTTAIINQGPGASAAVNVTQTQAAPVVGAALHIGVAQAQAGASALTMRVGLTGYWVTIP